MKKTEQMGLDLRQCRQGSLQSPSKEGATNNSFVAQQHPADAHRDNGKRFIVSANEKLTAFLELESAIRMNGKNERG
jgi:hypothetical protein